ncbi:unnamed protein product [Protopolystoma xenopodis]|uniref:Uncharacterized protein n=1 Tax=Protopolystoma xenopodis TaxID=117903 RepID=A0A3S5A5H3_9PLAT|nr:unnamed protein product [Protopolystoma xenopodis]
MALLATCAMHSSLRRLLWSNMAFWLEPTLAGLFSQHRSCREEACYALAYLFSEASLARDIHCQLNVDLEHDVAAAVVRAMETHRESFMHYYCLVGFILEGCPSFTVLECILERCPVSRCRLLHHIWPRFVYLAVKHWPLVHLQQDRGHLRRLGEALERAFLRPISRRQANIALLQLGIKYKRVSRLVTHWCSEWVDEV